MKRKLSARVGDFMAGQGFYIVLFLCVAAIGISGYFLLSSLGNGETAQVDQPTELVVTPTPQETQTAETQPPAESAAAPAGEPTEAPSPSVPASTAPTPSPEASPAAAPTAFTWPVKGSVVKDFSLEVLAYDVTMGDWRVHSGIDITAAAGTTVIAIAEGTVSQVYDDALMGTTVVVDHGGGLTSSYQNLAGGPPVSVGDLVERGTVIGSVGKTAMAESAMESHLHLEMAQNGVSVDPVNYLPE